MLKVIEDIDTQKVWQGETVDSDWPVYLFVRLMYCEAWNEEWAKLGQFHYEIEAVAPDAVGFDEIKRACECTGLTVADYNSFDTVNKCRVLSEYGIKAVLWQKQGNDEAELLADAEKELQAVGMLFGFYMDKPMNGMGNTGWDFIAGQIGFK